MMTRQILDRIYLVFLTILLPVMAQADETKDASPLSVVMAGREEAKKSMLTENGLISMTNSATNILLYVCGAAGIALAAYGIYYLWDSQRMSPEVRPKSPFTGVFIILVGGLMTIPAIMAAIAPNAILAAN